MRDFYRRHLPHYQPADGIFSVTFRLVDSLPESVVKAMVEEQELAEHWLQGLPDGRKKQSCFRQSREHYARRFDEALHAYSGGNRWLARPDIAQLVMDAFAYNDSQGCNLVAECIMSNHVHALLGLGDWASSIGIGGDEGGNDCEASGVEFPLTRALASIKKFTARRANCILGRNGAFWQDETYDHLIRGGEELERAAWYILMNPVKVGLCVSWEQWPWTYCSWLLERL